jgi:hypothetical protein
MLKRRHTIHRPKKHSKFDVLSKSKIGIIGTVIIGMLIILIFFIKLPSNDFEPDDFDEEGLFFAPGSGEGEEPDEEEALCLCTEDSECTDVNECTTSAVCEECSCIYEEIACENIDDICEAGECKTVVYGAGECGGNTPCECGDTLIHSRTLREEEPEYIQSQMVTIDMSDVFYFDGDYIDGIAAQKGVDANEFIQSGWSMEACELEKSNFVKLCNCKGYALLDSCFATDEDTYTGGFVSEVEDCKITPGAYSPGVKLVSKIRCYNSQVDQLNACDFGGVYQKNALTIGAEDLILDCDGNTIGTVDCSSDESPGINMCYAGIHMRGTDNTVIKNCNIDGGFYIGIYSSSDEIVLSNIHVTNTVYGILFDSYARNANLFNIITNNNHIGIQQNFIENSKLENIYTHHNTNKGIAIDQSDYITLSNVKSINNGDRGIDIMRTDYITLTNISSNENTRTGIKLKEVNNLNLLNIEVKDNDGGVSIAYSSDNILTNILAERNNDDPGLELLTVTNTVLTNITTRGNDELNYDGGLYLYRVEDSVISNFNIVDRLDLNQAHGNDISNGVIDTTHLIVPTVLRDSEDNHIHDITFLANQNAIYLNSARNNIITENKLISNAIDKPLYGLIYLSDSTDNHITNNEFTYIYDAFTYEGVSEEDNNIEDNTHLIICIDEDEDGYKTTINEVCGSLDDLDCNDINPLIHPSAPEYCDGIDYDCDGNVYEEDSVDCTVYYYDGDEDTYGLADDSRCLCEPVETWSATLINDCDDTNADVNPAMSEVCDNDIDENCNDRTDDVPVTFYADMDEDGYGDILNTIVGECFAPDGYVTNALDCDDSDVDEHPDATWYMNADNDSYYTLSNLCERGEGSGWVNTAELTQSDCDDTNAALYQILEGYADEDMDTYTVGDIQEVCSGDVILSEYLVAESEITDCNDSDSEHWTEETYVLDQDNDSYNSNEAILCTSTEDWYLTDTGHNVGEDCNDTNAAIYPNATETCNSIDDNCNGEVDEGDVCATKTTSSSSSGDGSSGGGGGSSSGSSTVIKANDTEDKETPSTVSTETPTTTQDKVVEEPHEEVEEPEELSFFGKIAEFFRNLFK